MSVKKLFVFSSFHETLLITFCFVSALLISSYIAISIYSIFTRQLVHFYHLAFILSFHYYHNILLDFSLLLVLFWKSFNAFPFVEIFVYFLLRWLIAFNNCSLVYIINPHRIVIAILYLISFSFSSWSGSSICHLHLPLSLRSSHSVDSAYASAIALPLLHLYSDTGQISLSPPRARTTHSPDSAPSHTACGLI